MCKADLLDYNDEKSIGKILTDLKDRCATPQKIALDRIENDRKLEKEVLSLLRSGHEIFLQQFAPFPHIYSKVLKDGIDTVIDDPLQNDNSASTSMNINPLYDILSLHLRIAKYDPIFYEEIGCAGGHRVLVQLIKLEVDESRSTWSETEYDDFYSLKDIACEIGSLCRPSFPLPYSPFTHEEIMKRLPLVFPLQACNSEITYPDILINQVQDRQSAQDDVGFVMWPSAVVLAHWIAANPIFVRNKTVLELGAGCGLTGIAAGITAKIDHSKNDDKNETSMDQIPKTHILLTDFNQKVIENLGHNIQLNGLDNETLRRQKQANKVSMETAKLDFYMHTNNSGMTFEDGWIDAATGQIRDPVDIILGADIICKPEDAVAVSKTVYNALKVGGEALFICADSKHRFGMDIFKEELEKFDGLNVHCQNVDGKDEYRNGNSGLHLTSGYIADMSLIMLRVKKIFIQ